MPIIFLHVYDSYHIVFQERIQTVSELGQYLPRVCSPCLGVGCRTEFVSFEFEETHRARKCTFRSAHRSCRVFCCTHELLKVAASAREPLGRTQEPSLIWGTSRSSASSRGTTSGRVLRGGCKMCLDLFLPSSKIRLRAGICILISLIWASSSLIFF